MIEKLEKRQLLSGTLASEGTVEVDLRAATVAAGTTNVISNLGNSGGTFNASGGAITVGPVTDASSTTYQAFEFSGTNAAVSSFTSPADLDGNNPRSIEVWVDNPTINSAEETMVSWAHRGGPNGTNESFSYGSSYGVGQWGGTGYDLQWTNTAPGIMGSGAAPSANTWHYLVFTYDGSNNDVYVDGHLYLQQAVAAGGLGTVGGLPINLAAQNDATASGFIADAATQGSLDIASVRIETGALTAADVTNNYVVGVPGRTATSAPATAPMLNALTGTDRFNLTWSYDPNATSYNVYRSDSAHSTPVAIATGVEALNYTDTAVTAGTAYTYYVTSVNNVGPGPASNTRSGTLSALSTAPTLNPPTVASGQVRLTWSSDPNALTYNVYRSDPVNTNPVAVAAGLTSLSYTDTSVTNGTTYTYYVTSVNNLGPGPASNTRTATPTAVPPAAPTDVSVTSVNSSGAIQDIVTFRTVTFATSYIVQRASESAPGSDMPGAFATVPGGAVVSGSGSTITFADNDPALQAGNTYFYQVYAVNSGGDSPASTPVAVFISLLKSEGAVEADVRAATLATGSVSTFSNLGAAGGTFAASGGAITVGPVTDADGVTNQALQFNGTNSATSSFTSPSDLNGNSSRSIEVWVDNPTIDNGEESMVSWATRGGPNGTNESFSYGNQYGVGQWGGTGYDLQWTNTAPGVMGPGAAPSANTWHYLVFTYDGSNDDVYMDGQLYLQQPVAAGGLATFAGFPVNLAAQNTATIADDFTAALNGSLDLASVRIEAGALTPSDVVNNYVVGVPGRAPATAAPTTAPTLNPLTANGRLKLSWSYDRNAFSYDVHRIDPAHPTPVTIATGLTSLSYTDTSITAGTTYTYYVTSVNNIGQGPPSNSESGSVNALTTAPTLNVPLAGNDTVTLSWSSDPNAADYDVYRSDPANPTPAAVATALTALTFTDNTVVNGTTYTYYVTSENAVGQGPDSNTETATPTLPGPFQPVNILTHHTDAANDGLNASESVLTPANVNATDFGKLYSDALDGGDVIAEPLYMQNVDITSGASPGIHSVLFVATEADGLYAIDANTGAVLWHDNFTNITDPTNLTPTTRVTTVQQSDIAGNPDVGPQLGILATPAIDAQTGVIYLNANTKEIRSDGKHFVQRLWAISISNGAAVTDPTVIGDTIAPDGLSTTGPYTYVAGPIINGTGNNNPAGNPTPVYPDTDGWTAAPGGATGYVIAFNAIEQMERTAVTLVDGSVYLGFASHGDDGPYYGWVLGYNASTLAPNAVFNTTPTYEATSVVDSSQPFQSEGGIWASGSAIATDGTNLYVATGNGAFNGDPSNFGASGFPIDHDYGDSVLKLTPDLTSSPTNQNGNGWGLKVSDYFTPSNQYELNALDLDLGSGGVTLLPDNVLDAAGNPMLVIGGKESRIYLIDVNNMGKFNYSYPTGATNVNPAPYDRVVAEYANNGTNTGGKQIYSSASYYDGNIYIGVNGSPALELNVANMIAGNVTPVKTDLDFGYPGETFQISSDGNSDGIAWAENPGGSDLLAYDAANFTAPIYDSNTNPGDALGGTIHFHVPTEANGMVYAGSRGGGLGGYGLKLSYLTSNPAFFSAPSDLSAVWASAADIYLTWTSNSSLATEFRIDRAPFGTSNWSTIAYVGNSNTSYNDTTMTAGTAYQYRVIAISGANTTAPSLTAVPLPAGVTASSGAVYAYSPTTNTLSLTSGTLTFNNVGAASSLTLNVSADGAGSNLVFDTTTYLNSLTLTDGATAQLVQSGADTVTGAGANAVLVNYGTTLAQANTKVLALNSLSIPVAGATLAGGGTNSAQGKLDLTNNAMILNYTAGSSDAALTAADTLTGDGSDGGIWDGTGITSSNAEADNNNNGYTAIGVADNRDLGYNTFAGQNVSSRAQILFMFTYNGDADLNGIMNVTDTISYEDGLKTHPGGPAGSGWEYGALDYGATPQGSLSDFQLLEAGFRGCKANGGINISES